MERPPDCSALNANSRATWMTVAAGTEVISSCQAGVCGWLASSYDSGQVPGRPSRPTPYDASIKS